MARSGRRLVIGGSGILSEDDSLAATGARGEVHRYVPLSAEELAKQQPKAEEPKPEPAALPTIVNPPQGGDTSAPSGDPTSDVGAPPGGGEAGTVPTGTGASGVPGSDTVGGGEAGPGPGGPPGSPDDGGPGDGPGVEHKGGPISIEEAKQPVKLLAGEWVIQRSAVKKYGAKMLRAINEGRLEVAEHDDYIAKHAAAKQGFAKGKRLT